MRREQRLRRRRDFDAVYRTGRLVHTGFLSVRVRRTELERSRIGLAVTKRAGGAVMRNRIKRRLRAAIDTLGLPGGWDVVITARAPAATVPYDELVRVLTRALRRARVLPEGGNSTQGGGNSADAVPGTNEA